MRFGRGLYFLGSGSFNADASRREGCILNFEYQARMMDT